MTETDPHATRPNGAGRMTGTRIRERRLARGVAQGALAREAGISPSYLNLIEHNRRRIGGRVLLRLADALEVDAQTLSHGGEAALLSGLGEAAGAVPGAAGAELDRLEEFAGRFPGWAQLLVQTLRRAEAGARQAEALTDRLAHDPHLAASLHEVLSVVTAIRSTASILSDTAGLEPEWQARFHRNLGEDSQRLADGAERLVRYLDDGPGTGRDAFSPQEELDRFLDDAGHHFPRLETGQADPAALLATDGIAPGTAAHALGLTALERYRADALAVPRARLMESVAAHGLDPLMLSQALGAPPAQVLRRLAAMPEDALGPTGLVVADASGAILRLKPLDGFAATRLAGACPLWPLFRAAMQPGGALNQRLIQPGQDARAVLALTATELAAPPVLNMPPLMTAYMLLLPDAGDVPAAPVGAACRICPRAGCAARREPTILPPAPE